MVVGGRRDGSEGSLEGADDPAVVVVEVRRVGACRRRRCEPPQHRDGRRSTWSRPAAMAARQSNRSSARAVVIACSMASDHSTHASMLSGCGWVSAGNLGGQPGHGVAVAESGEGDRSGAHQRAIAGGVGPALLERLRGVGLARRRVAGHRRARRGSARRRRGDHWRTTAPSRRRSPRRRRARRRARSARRAPSACRRSTRRAPSRSRHRPRARTGRSGWAVRTRTGRRGRRRPPRPPRPRRRGRSPPRRTPVLIPSLIGLLLGLLAAAPEVILVAPALWRDLPRQSLTVRSRPA